MIELFINDKQVEFTNPPEINIVLQHEDTHNPTIIKNNFSHTIQINGTKENNKLFGCFYDNTRINGDDVFNANKKVPFVLYNNGDIVEQGYCKLTEVKRKGNDVEYSIMLFGGLGQFLYSLSYKEDGEEMKLSDLTYTDDDSRKLNFVVNRDTIIDAWSEEINNDDSRYSIINFAPCYNGIPSDFDANKVVINTNNLPDSISLNTTKDDEGVSYTDINGYVLAELPNELDDTQVKDYRSYLQRPVIRMKSILNACFNPINNNGWEIDLDEDFFNDENPYYNDVWMTLPMITENKIYDNLGVDIIDDKIYLTEEHRDREYINFNLKFIPTCSPSNVPDSSQLIRTGRINYSNGNYTAVCTALMYELIAYNENDEQIAVSRPIAFRTNIENTNYFQYPSNSVYPIGFVKEVYGLFKKYDFDTFYFVTYPTNGNNEVGDFNYFNLNVNVIYHEGIYFKLKRTELAIKNDNGNVTSTSNYYLYGYNETYYTPNFNEVFNFEDRLSFIKDEHLKSENTPCKYMLDYLKMFNLHIWHDTYENKIHIRKRENYFTHNIKDINNIIDRGKEMTITPLTFENKWLSFGSEYNTENVLAKEYIDNYGYSYGVQRVNTNYNFDSSTKDLFSDSIYKGGIMTQRKNKYYAVSSNEVPSFFLDGLTTYLFNDEGETIEGDKFNPESTFINWKLSEDIIPRCSFVNENNEEVNGENVLLLFNGFKEVGREDNLRVTDDIKEFDRLNDNTPCWIYTNINYNIKGEEIAKHITNLPLFSRYKVDDNNSYIIKSLDFGTPQVIYLNLAINNDSNIYTQYWKPYITDKLSVDNRLVTAYVLFNKQMKNDDLREFYYFDNSYWVLSEIETSVGQNNVPSKAIFYKVLDINNYL